jgi:hypothetical protein
LRPNSAKIDRNITVNNEVDGDVIAPLVPVSLYNPAAEVRPDDEWSVFQASDTSEAGVIAFNLKPVVFNLPKRADDFKRRLVYRR